MYGDQTTTVLENQCKVAKDFPDNFFFLKMEEESWVGFCLLLLCLSAKGRKFLGVNKPAACVDVVNAFRENPTCIQECLWR